MTIRERRWLAVLAAAVIVRLLTLPAYALHDTTEARYAEIARLMVVSGDWIVPQIEPGVPFWGKPPLSIWLTTGSFEIFGLNELAARLPHFVMTLLTSLLVYVFGRRFLSRETGIAAVAVFLTTVLGFVLAGAVMTDAALVASTTLAMVGFWHMVKESSRRWVYAVFIAAGLGLLAKGPVALVLIGLPIAGWTAMRGGLGSISRLPWVSGSLLAAAIALPWYGLAEHRSPGFMEYFIIGEHWSRFVDAGWQGDLYGNAHDEPRGMIWLFALAVALPWSIPAARSALAWLRSRPRLSLEPLQAYLLCWFLAPLVFFTFSGNILPTYVATGLPAFALLVAVALAGKSAAWIHLGWTVPGIIATAVVLVGILGLPTKTERGTVAWAQSRDPAAPLYFYPRKPFSADFYSRGMAREAASLKQLEPILADRQRAFVALRDSRADRVLDLVAGCLVERARSARYALFEKRPSACRDLLTPVTQETDGTTYRREGESGADGSVASQDAIVRDPQVMLTDDADMPYTLRPTRP